MTIDLAEIGIDWLIHCATNERNTTPLVKYIRRGYEIPPRLSLVIADLLEGKIKASAKQESKVNKKHKLLLNGQLGAAKEFLRGNTTLDHKTYPVAYTKLLEIAGYEGNEVLDAKGEISKVAKKYVARLYNLTDSQLESILTNRSERKKKRVK